MSAEERDTHVFVPCNTVADRRRLHAASLAERLSSVSMSRVIVWLEGRSRAAINGLALSILLVISAIDFLTPPAISTFVFYTIPIALAAWFAGRASGLATALLAAGAWMTSDVALRGAPYSEPAILFWNTAARSITFVLVVRAGPPA